jgi:large subunit ribosomal protein L24
MATLKIKKGDTVFVIAGNSKDNKPHRVLEVLHKEGKAIVEGVNIVSKSTKPNAKAPQGGIIKKEAPIDLSNLAVADPKTGKPTRVGFRFNEDGKKVRYAKKSGEEIK